MTSDDWAFLVSGLINNLTYVVFLSAATDIVSTSASGSEGIILLADIVPSLLVKLIFPQVMHRISYGIRIMACTILSFMALQIVAWMDDFGIRLFGIVLASISSGVGEISFLSLSSFHRASVLGFWGVGTGAAGVVGSFVSIFTVERVIS